MVPNSQYKIVTKVLSICSISFPLLNPIFSILQNTIFFGKFVTICPISPSRHSETKGKLPVFLNPISALLQVLHCNLWCQTCVSLDPQNLYSRLYIISCVALIFAICEVMSPSTQPPQKSFWLSLGGPTTKMFLIFYHEIVIKVLSICSISFPLFNPIFSILQNTFSFGKFIISFSTFTILYFSPCEALIFAICGVMSLFLTLHNPPPLRTKECAPSFSYSCFVLPCLFVSQLEKLSLIGL
jgi:hypothetical protein